MSKIESLVKQAGGETYTGIFGSPNSVKFCGEELDRFVQLLVEEVAQHFSAAGLEMTRRQVEKFTEDLLNH
jgi:hypothetical protein